LAVTIKTSVSTIEILNVLCIGVLPALFFCDGFAHILRQLFVWHTPRIAQQLWLLFGGAVTYAASYHF